MNRNETDYSSLFALNIHPILVYDVANYAILDVNVAAVNQYGFTKSEFLSYTILDLLQKEQIPNFITAQDEIYKKEANILLGSFGMSTKQGKVIQTELNGHRLFLNDKNCIIVYCNKVKEISNFDAPILMDSFLDVFCIINEQFKFEYLNAASLPNWGYSPEELIGVNFYDLIFDEEVFDTNAIVKEIKSCGNTKTFFNRYKKKSGDLAYNFWSARWDPNTRLFYCVSRDGKDKLELNEKVLQSTERFKALVQDSFDMLAILDVEGNYKYVSPTSSAILGIAPEDFTGKNAFDFIHPDDVEKALQSLQNIYIEKRVHLEPFRFQNKDKEWRWVDTVLTNMLDNPAVLGIVANSRDVTDKIKERHTLKLLESVITNTKDAVIITEAETLDFPGPKIIYVNEAFTEMTGYKPEEVIGLTPRILQGINSNKEDLALLGSALRKFQPYEVTTINYKKDRSEFWVNFTVTPIANELGVYTHFIGVQRDVTEQKLIERENELFKIISKIFKENNDYKSAAEEVCKLVCHFGKLDCGELWTINLDKSQMHLLNYYNSSIEECPIQQNRNDQRYYQLAEGLVGKVWESQEIIYAVAEPLTAFFSDFENKTSLNAIVGIPLLYNNEVMGVLKLGTNHSSDYLIKYSKIFERLKVFLGSELQRKQIENDLLHLFDSIPDIVGLVNFKGRFLKINKVGADLLGFKPEEVLNEKFETFIHPDDQYKVKNYLSGEEAMPATFQFESRYTSKTGNISWLSWYCSVSFSDELIYVSGKNITNEKNLRELNRQAGRLARIGNGQYNLLNQTFFWSDEMHEIYETDPATFVPTIENALSFFRPDFHELILSKVANCIEKGTAFDFQVVLLTANKREVWVRLTGVSEFSEVICTRIYGSIQDINEQKEAETRLQSLADNLPGVVYQYIIYADGSDALKFVSKGAKELWGFSVEEVLENSNLIWNQIKISGETEKVKASIEESIFKRSKWTARWHYTMPTGEIKTHLGNATPIFLTDGTIVFNAVVLDVTHETKNVELLEEVSKLATIGSWEYSFETHQLYWSEMVHRIAGTTSETYNPEIETALVFFTENFRSVLSSKLTVCMKKGVSVDFEAEINSIDGTSKWIRILANAEMKGERCIKIYGSVQDIHSSKSLELRITEILGSISDGFYAIDNDWKFTYFNKEAETLLKVNEKDILGKKIWDIFPDVVGTKLDELYHSIAETNLPETFEFFFTSNQKWYEISAYPSAGGIAVYFKNIDERRSAAERFQKLFAEKNKILESIGDVFFAIDNDWIVTYWNRHAEETLNVKKESIIGKNVWKEFPSSINGIFYTNYYTAIETKQPVNFDTYSDVMKAWYEVSVFPSEEGLSVFLKDITLKKEGNIQLIKANERFEKVTEATNDVIWDWDIANKTYYRSKAIERFFGKSTSKLLMTDEFWQDSFHPQDLKAIQESVRDTIEDPNCFRWELQYRIINEDNTIVYIEDRGVIVRNQQGIAIRMVGAMTDISEQKSLEYQLSEMNKSLQQYANELERSNKELEQFAFVASHDLQEPLRMVSSFMDQLKRKYGAQLDEKAHQYIFFATDGAKRMKQIILDLLDYSRASKPTEGAELVKLNDVLAEFMQLRRKVIKEKHAIITSQELPVLLTYKAPVTQVLHCLLDNALTYSQPDIATKIEIHFSEEHLEYVFSIKDNGIGIDSQFFSKIFIIFQRLHGKDKYEGTGIGLSIAKRHIELLGGRIWLESKVGEGTTFYFTIPKRT